MTSDSREQFEEWAGSSGYSLARLMALPDKYMSGLTASAQDAWSARDSEVERLREALEMTTYCLRWHHDHVGREVDQKALDAASAAMSQQEKSK